ncbi:uncharacterized protein LOC114360259 [Ostrinia furnacalis]|uniref:uncharacterized protein LOC114360259 n=1 Tax=Ostrinia furnacalis TaxID=93504 RepID=UPI00103A54B1|nr:uncharacterized protein LOC114360259 [Ostrinia furnacalis]
MLLNIQDNLLKSQKRMRKYTPAFVLILHPTSRPDLPSFAPFLSSRSLLCDIVLLSGSGTKMADAVRMRSSEGWPRVTAGVKFETFKRANFGKFLMDVINNVDLLLFCS